MEPILPGSHHNLYPVVLPHFLPSIVVKKMVEQFREHLRHALKAESMYLVSTALPKKGYHRAVKCAAGSHQTQALCLKGASVINKMRKKRIQTDTSSKK